MKRNDLLKYLRTQGCEFIRVRRTATDAAAHGLSATDPLAVSTGGSHVARPSRHPLRLITLPLHSKAALRPSTYSASQIALDNDINNDTIEA